MLNCKGGIFRCTTLPTVINVRPFVLSFETASPVTWRKRPNLLTPCITLHKCYHFQSDAPG